MRVLPELLLLPDRDPSFEPLLDPEEGGDTFSRLLEDPRLDLPTEPEEDSLPPPEELPLLSTFVPPSDLVTPPSRPPLARVAVGNVVPPNILPDPAPPLTSPVRMCPEFLVCVFEDGSET